MAERIRATGCPQAKESATGILSPPEESEMLELLGRVGVK